jgi:hypothetical protein
MSRLPTNDQQFIERRRKAVKALRLSGWAMVVVGVTMTILMWTKLDRLHQRFSSEVARQHAAWSTPAPESEREADLLREVIRQDDVITDMIRLVVLALVGFSVGVLLLQGFLMVHSAIEHERFLKVVDRLQRAGRS